MRRYHLEGAGTRTTPILKRGRGNRTRDDRLDQMKQGPGVFVYRGKHEVKNYSPTFKMATKRQPVLDARGRPTLDSSGRPLMKEVSVDFVKDHNSRPELGGAPDIEAVELENAPVWGVDFPLGVPVRVDSDELALKLRCLPFHCELEGDELEAFERGDAGEDATPKKRSRKGKSDEAIEKTE